MVPGPTPCYLVDSLEESAYTRPQAEAESTAITQLSDPEPNQRHPSDFHDFILGATEAQTRGGSEGKNEWLNWRLAKPHSLSSGTRQPIHPTYLSGDKISGVVILGAERPKITSIRIQLIGRLISTWRRVWSRASVIQFVDFEHQVWPDESATFKTQEEGKLGKTQEALHFSFDFPSQIDLATFKGGRSGKKTKDAPVFSCTPPPTVKEPNVTVEYLLSLVVDHGRFRSPSSIDVPIVYILKTTPPSPLRLRTAAYQEGNTPPPPSMDPEGWYKEGPLRIHGVAPREREEDITFDYRLYLSQPLFYTCGTAIPCHLKVACGDQSILDLLSSPQAHAVRLLCRLKVCDEKAALASYLQTQQSPKAPPDKLRPTQLHHSAASETTASGWRFSERSVGMCTFWEHHDPSGESQGDSTSTTSAASSKGSSSASKKSRRSAKWPYVTFDGELHLDRSLLPSFDSGILSIEYFVQVLPFEDSIFDSKPFAGTEDDDKLLTSELTKKPVPVSHRLQQPPLVSIPVQIGTMRPPGPRQIIATLPSDQASLLSSKRDYNASTYRYQSP